MGREVWKEAYEIVGSGIPVAEEFYAKRDVMSELLWSVVTGLGAEGYRPGASGGIYSLFFGSVPSGFRKIGYGESGTIECVPHKRSAAGKVFASKIASSPRVPPEHTLANSFGWESRRPIDGRLIYSAVAARLSLPSVRYLLRLPRQLDDGWVPPDELRPIPMSEFIRAFEDHNEAARKINESVEA